jgi:hypothetical protein
MVKSKKFGQASGWKTVAQSALVILCWKAMLYSLYILYSGHKSGECKSLKWCARLCIRQSARSTA